MRISSVNKIEFLAMFEHALKDAVGDDAFTIDEGMRYATLDGGKRVRPMCVYLGARGVGDADADEIVRLAVGVELVHNYSLVHDDLPAMDNDDYRRGKLSVHKKFGHANGILIGDQLLTLASCKLLDGARVYGTTFARAAQEITFAAKEMVRGQAIDLAGCQSEEDYLDMYSQKTAALIRGALKAGAICAGATFEQIEKMEEFGELMGVCFQLADDLLDEGEENSIVSLIGEEAVKDLLAKRTEKACQIARENFNADELCEFANALAKREK